MESLLKDPALADEGRSKVAYAGRRMPVLTAIREEFAASQPFKGRRISACLHVTTETANVVRALIEGGAEMAVCASNPLSTKDDVAAAIHVDFGAEVYAINGCDRDTFYKQIEGVLAFEPDIIIDDGADLTSTIHRERPELLEKIVAGTEVTSTGVLRLRNMHRDGRLKYPVVAVNDAKTKHLFDNRYGTGQNTIDGIMRGAHTLLAGSVLVVSGYGWCGRGIAMRADGMGARVIVVEIDPIKALEAVMDGYQVMPIADAAPVGDIFVTATGNRDVIRYEHMEKMKPGAIICNSGHFDVEIDMETLEKNATSKETIRSHAVQYELPSGTSVVVLAEGRLVGQAAAEAHPAEVMDMTFSSQALAMAWLAENAETLPLGVHTVPADIDERVSRLKLESFGVKLDELTPAQHEYLDAWEVGT